MSFYSSRAMGRFGVSAAVQSLYDAMTPLGQQMIAALQASNAADAALQDAIARVAAAKALSAQLERLDTAWFEDIHQFYAGNRAVPSPADLALFNKYRMTFPITPAGTPNFEAPNDHLFEDQQAAQDAIMATEDAVPGFRAAASKAKAALDAAQAVNAAANKKYETAVKAEEKAAADVVKAKAQAASDAVVAKDLAVAKALARANGPSPLTIAAIAVPVLGVIAYALTRKRSAPVAGYRRRSRK